MLKINKKSIPQMLYLADDELVKLGYRYVGSGASARVFLKPESDYVLKLFRNSDTGYKSFLRFIAANPGNPHLPRLRGKFHKLNDTFSAVRVEALTELRYDDPAGTTKGLSELNWFLKSSYLNRPFSPAMLTEKARGALPDSFIDTIMQLDRWNTDNPGGAWDIHTGNVMRREGTLVIIDPFYIDYGQAE